VGCKACDGSRKAVTTLQQPFHQGGGQPRVIERVDPVMKLSEQWLHTMTMALACMAAGACWSMSLEDVSYGQDRAQAMDVHAPSDAKDAPIILMVHGGGWRFGDKTSRGVVDQKIERWVPRGLIVISANYRMLPDADVLEQAGDVARSLAYVQAHAEAWGGDPRKVILMGHSAGAHLVSLLTADPDLALVHGAQRWLGTVSIDTGAIDVPAIMQRRHLPLYDQAFGADPEFWKATSPTHVITGKALPLLGICSSIRPDRPCDQTREYLEIAKSKQVRAEMLEQPLDHMKINATLGLESPYTRAVEAFMASLDPSVAARLNPN
jgi:acetyl esterase/lipase